MFKRECIIAQSLSLSNSTTFNDIKMLACANWKINPQDYILALDAKQNYMKRDKLFKPVNINDLANKE